MKRFFFIVYFLPFFMAAQNLVLNPSFEITTKPCAEAIGDFQRHVQDWSTPTAGSSDVFNTCSTGRTAAPYNFSGHQEPQFGEKYAGAYFYHSERPYREYIQGKLSESLEKGRTYKISFYVSLSETSDYALERIGFMLSERKLNSAINSVLSEEELERSKIDFQYAFFEIENDKAFDDKNEWMLLSKEVVANGNENYILIGNFKENKETPTKQLSNEKINNKAYYYLDMVSVEPMNRPRIIETATLEEAEMEPELISGPEQMKFNKSYVFENIMFDFDSSVLKDSAKEQIKSIHGFLQKHKEVFLKITGHTDSKGSLEFNQVLSEERAKAVAKYLLELGLEENRLTLAAFGKLNPIKPNKTDFGRSLNRRVEFRIFKEKPSAE